MSYLDANKHSNIAEHINWILSELSVGVHKMLNRTGCTCAFYKRCGLQSTARLNVLFKLLNVKKTINIFLAHFRFSKKLQIFLMLLYWVSCMQPHPYQNLHWYPLSSSKSIWPKISVAYFTKWFQSIFTVGWWRMCPFSLSLLPTAYIPTQSCKRASFWSLNPARTRLDPES